MKHPSHPTRYPPSRCRATTRLPNGAHTDNSDVTARATKRRRQDNTRTLTRRQSTPKIRRFSRRAFHATTKEAEIQAWNGRIERDSTISEEHGVIDAEAAVCAVGKLNHRYVWAWTRLLIRCTCAGARGSTECTADDERSIAVAVASYPSTARGRGSLSGAFVRRHEPVRHPCEARDDHAEGYPAGEENTRSLGWVGMNAIAQDTMFRGGGAVWLFF